MKYVVNIVKVTQNYEPAGSATNLVERRERFFSTSRGSIGDSTEKLAQVVGALSALQGAIGGGYYEAEVFAIANGTATRCNLDGSVMTGTELKSCPAGGLCTNPKLCSEMSSGCVAKNPMGGE